jgi:hypothetical protein
LEFSFVSIQIKKNTNNELGRHCRAHWLFSFLCHFHSAGLQNLEKPQCRRPELVDDANRIHQHYCLAHIWRFINAVAGNCSQRDHLPFEPATYYIQADLQEQLIPK